LFEHLCLQMIVSEFKSRDQNFRISVYRTDAGAEVDFIIEKDREVFAIEVKATRKISSQDLRGLKSFKDFYGKKAEAIIIYLGAETLEIDGVKVLPLAQAISIISD